MQCIKKNLYSSFIFLFLFEYVKTYHIFEWQINSINPYCYMKECCNDDYINFRRNRLHQNLSQKVFGQPLLQTAVDALSAHYNPHYKPKKALTLSFHGMTGTGKNYVSDFIADSVFTRGIKSQYVHHYIGRMHFSEQRHVEKYKDDLYNSLKRIFKECSRSLIIFDEVDKMIPDVLNSIKPIIDYREEVEGIDYSEGVFIFLSNTGADVINEHYQDLWSHGMKRENMKISDFETFIQKGAFNEKGGFHMSDTIKNNLIDHYIPFLPLEEQHVEKCILKEFAIRDVSSPKREHIEEVKQIIEWGPDSSKLFSKTGCKRLGQKVAVLADKFYRHVSYNREDL